MLHQSEMESSSGRASVPRRSTWDARRLMHSFHRNSYWPSSDLLNDSGAYTLKHGPRASSSPFRSFASRKLVSSFVSIRLEDTFGDPSVTESLAIQLPLSACATCRRAAGS